MAPQHIRSAPSSLISLITWQEVSGAFGDLGTFLPLVVAVTKQAGVDLGTTLLFTGVYNVISGVSFRIPMCVQPMKAIAASAITGGMTIEEIMAAGIFVSAAVLLLGVTRLIDIVNMLVPPPLIRGIQLGLGIKLAMQGLLLASKVKQGSVLTWRPWLGPQGLLLGCCCVLFILVTTMQDIEPQQAQLDRVDTDSSVTESHCSAAKRLLDSECIGSHDQAECGVPHVPSLPAEACSTATEPRESLQPPRSGSCRWWWDPCGSSVAQAAAKPVASITAVLSTLEARTAHAANRSPCRVPTALLVVITGLVITLIDPVVRSGLKIGPMVPQVVVPSGSDFKAGIMKAGLPQLPLTTLNSVLAVTQLANALFPEQHMNAWRWRPSLVSASVGIMNLMGCWFGAFPACHGLGGLAAQYKFGARHGAAPIILGCTKILLALLLGSSLFELFTHFPDPLLGGLLLFSGIELASTARQQTSGRGFTFLLLTACAILALNDTGQGFAVGYICWLVTIVYEGVVIPCIVAAASWLRRSCARARDTVVELHYAPVD